MRRIEVGLTGREYPIYIGSGLLNRSGELLRDTVPPGRRVVVADRQTFSHHGAALVASLEADSFPVETVLLAGGEETKSLEGATDLYFQLSRLEVERKDSILALGGGVTGDLAGFVASTYLRGLPFVQIPTTLLAQVDSSVGGKVGVNLGVWKNLVGSFYQPRAVIIDVETLSTLPAAEFSTGLAEVIKTAFLIGEDFLSFLEKNFSRVTALDGPVLERVVEECCRYKAAVVQEDEKESGKRRVLNFGHTLGHAIEAATDFRWRHGEAVAVGMLFALQVAGEKGVGVDLPARMRPLLSAAGLPVELPQLGVKAVLEALKMDKKREGGRIAFVLLEDVGSPVFHDVDEEELAAMWSRLAPSDAGSRPAPEGLRGGATSASGEVSTG